MICFRRGNAKCLTPQQNFGVCAGLVYTDQGGGLFCMQGTAAWTARQPHPQSLNSDRPGCAVRGATAQGSSSNNSNKSRNRLTGQSTQMG